MAGGAACADGGSLYYAAKAVEERNAVGMSVIASEEERRPLRPEDSQPFEILRELARNGYVPDPRHDGASGIRLRHDSAPDLVLHADGRIDVPLGQRRKPVGDLAALDLRRISWPRTIAVLALMIVLCFFSVVLTVTLIESM